MNKKKLYVFSFDAMVGEDLEILKDKPNFGRFLKGSSRAESIRSIYPTITYPNHVSILTGCTAGKHGILENYPFSLDWKNTVWCWYNREIKVRDIFEAAKRGGYSTGCVFWPVTGCNPNIDYLVNEYWMPFPTDTLESSFRDTGSSPEMLKIVDRHKDLLPPTYIKTGRANFGKQPYVDDFLYHVAADVIREYNPDVFFAHGALMDDTRHHHGIFNAHTAQALDQVDAWFGLLLDAIESVNNPEDVNICVVSDHGQRDFARVIHPNAYFLREGLFTLDEKGEVADWKAFCLPVGMSTLVYLKDRNDKALYDRVYKLLCDMQSDALHGFSRVYTAEEAKAEEGLYGDFSFVLETDGYTSFGNGCEWPPSTVARDFSDYRTGRATHGYHPDLGPQPIFVCKGPDFVGGKTIGRHSIIDEAPTFAKLLGVDMPDAEGKAMDELLK